jgi:predicted dehydrogenase
MSSPINFGLIGAGAISQAYLQALRDVDGARLAAVVDPLPDVLATVKESQRCEVFPSVDQLLSHGCEAAIVCTPPNTHVPICRALLEESVPVLCEKPLCFDSGDAEQLIELADRHGVLFSMATKFRFVEDIIEARHMMLSGIVGDVQLLQNAFTARVDMSRRWNSDPDVAGGGVLIDNGTHSVDLIRYFLGPISAVQAFEGRRIQNIPVEDNVQLITRTYNNVIGSIDLSWSLSKDLPNYVEIYGSQGTIRVGWQRSMYKQASSSDWVEFGSGYNKVRAFYNQIVNFCRAIRGEEGIVVTAQDALASVRVIEAAYRSMMQNHWVPIGNGVHAA